MYNDEYEDEESEKTSENFFVNFYYNNKILVWIFIGIILFILLISLFTRGGNDTNPEPDDTNYEVIIYPEDENIYLSIGRSVNLKAQVKDNPTANITWSVDDPNVASVTDSGNVRGLNYGTTTVTALYIDKNSGDHSKKTNIIVSDGDPNVPLTDVSFKEGDLFMPLSQTYQIALALTPSNGFVQNESFISSDINVVTVDNTGLVTSVGEGNAVITVDVNNGQFRKELNVYVDKDFTKKEIIVTPENIFFDGELRKMQIGGVEKLSYTVRPQNADVNRLTWKSNDESVLKVENGVVTALKEGRAVITVSALNGQSDQIDIEVEKEIINVRSITVSNSVINLKVGKSKTITPVVKPDDASNKALSYTSLDDNIAFVDPNETGTKATITGISAGSTTIVIESSNNIRKNIKVVVTDPSNSNNNNNNNNNGGGSYYNPTPTPTPRPTASPSNPVITCLNPTYNGKKQNVATCTNGTFTTKGSSSYFEVGNPSGNYYTLVCQNTTGGYDAKTCRIKPGVTPTPTAFSCSGKTINACNSGQAASYCSWCRGGCHDKSYCNSIATPSPTIKVTTGVIKKVEIDNAWTVLDYKASLREVTIDATSKISKIHYCIGTNCTVSDSSTVPSYVNRGYLDVTDPTSKHRGVCTSGDVGKTYVLDGNRPSSVSGGIIFNSSSTQFKVPFCVASGQSIKIKVYFSNGTSKQYGPIQF